MGSSKGLPTLADFSARTGAIFHANRNGGSFDFRLESTQSFVDNPKQTNFSVLFTAPGHAPAEQGIYSLENDALGRIDLFLTPVGRDADGIHFEAVFNHIHNA